MQDWKDGKEPKVGPQNGRINSCGIGEEGRTSLYGEPTGPISRDFAAEKASYDEAKAAAAAAAKKWASFHLLPLSKLLHFEQSLYLKIKLSIFLLVIVLKA